MPYLALILFAPWFLILGALYWFYPRQPRTSARRAFDAVVLLLACGGSFYGMLWGYEVAIPMTGAIWKQVLASLVAYGVFLGVLTAAWIVRPRLLRRD